MAWGVAAAFVVVDIVVSLEFVVSADLMRCNALISTVASASTKRLVLKMVAGLDFQAPSCDRKASGDAEDADDDASRAPPRGKNVAMRNVASLLRDTGTRSVSDFGCCL